ncbi:MAG: hypothetical protein J2P37_20655 [Ktedonobacteraceae bacterium]|nr:hypothetical protein [Ktedonobacteraceae bacterium]
MFRDNIIDSHTILSTLTEDELEQDTLDTTILTYMAKVVQRTYEAMGPLQHVALSFPYITNTSRHTVRTHRVVIYDRLPAGQEHLPFVGFLSKKHREAGKPIADQISDMDRLLVSDLAEHRGLLNYSSLELSDGAWCNLVTFSQATIKEEIQSRQAHRHAAYELAPHYYEWIRLHHGQFAGGDLSEQPALHLTKYYTFHRPSLQPSMRVQVYAAQEQPSPAMSQGGISQ